MSALPFCDLCKEVPSLEGPWLVIRTGLPPFPGPFVPKESETQTFEKKYKLGEKEVPDYVEERRSLDSSSLAALSFSPFMNHAHPELTSTGNGEQVN